MNMDKQTAPLPRGCRFHDLGEAHRNITGRNISALYGTNPVLTGSTSNNSNSTNNTDPMPSSRDITSLSPLTLSPFTAVVTRREASRSSVSPSSTTIPERLATPEELIDEIFSCNESPKVSVMAMGSESGVKGCPIIDKNASPPGTPNSPVGKNRSSGSQFINTMDSGDTAVCLYKRYQECFLGDKENSNSPTPVITQYIPYAQTGVANQHGIHSRSPRRFTPSTSSPGALPSEPRVHNDKRERNHTPPGTANPKTKSMNLSTSTRESLLYPKPLRVQSVRIEEKRTSLSNGISTSATGMTTDSDDDPFRYDKDPYTIFLHPSKERDVSTALNHISGLSSHSGATLHSYDDDTPVRTIALRSPPIPKEYLDDDPFSSGPTRARSQTPESVDGFYDTSIIQSNRAFEHSTYEVKVVLQDTNHNINVATRRALTADDIRVYDNEKLRPPSLISPPHVGTMSHQRGKENMLSSERDDWETVETSAVGFDSLHFLSGRRGGGVGVGVGQHAIKITGSSVADVSDDSSFHRMPFDEYASTDRIVEHPSGHEGSEESLQIRHLSGTKFPIILPKQRIHRVNGFAQDSSRVFLAPRLSGGEAAPVLAKKVSSPLRQLNVRRPPRFSPTPLQSLSYGYTKGRGRVEPQNNAQPPNGDMPYLNNVGPRETGPTIVDIHRTTTSNDVHSRQDDAFSLGGSDSSQSSHGTVHSFQFPLISLPEAARLQAAKRTAALADTDICSSWIREETPMQRIFPAQKSRPRSPATFLASLLIPSSTESSRFNGSKKKRTIPKDLTMAAAFSSATGGDSTWTTIFPFGSTSTRHVRPYDMLRSTATKLHLNDLVRKFQTRKKSSFTIGSSVMSRSNTPRLYPWDYPARCRQHMRETDSDLRTIALAELENGPCGNLHRTVHDLERDGVPLNADAFLSWEARRSQRIWFCCMAAISAFPFISVLVYLGKFDSGLSWFTRGEVDHLNARQRRVIFAIMVVQFVLWPLVLALAIWKVQQLSN